jgi:radical SAM protein with 4Fe4S-binding SPASM domain
MVITLNDAIRFIKKLSVPKLWNAFKLICSFYITKHFQKAFQWGLPMTISIEPTTACNLRCPECPSGLRSFTREQGNLKRDFFTKILNEMGRELMYIIFYFQGEPYINPDFLKMVKIASDRRIYTITSTNAHFLNDENARKTIESGLDRMIISIDGTTQEVYEQYRRSGNLEHVLQGARNMVKWKKKMGIKHPHLIFQFLVVRPNEHQMEELAQLASEIGIDEVKFKSAQVYDYENGNPFIPRNEKYSRYVKEKDGSYSVKHKLVNRCWKLTHSCVITWDGLVVPCCFDKDAVHRLGDLKENSFKEIWHGSAYSKFRNKIIEGRSQIDICKNCTEGCEVWL